MLTRDHVLTAFAYLGRIGLKPPMNLSTAESAAACADTWIDVLNPMLPDQFASGIKAHLRDPERGSYWPTPSDILRHTEAIAAAAYPDAAAAFPLVLRIRGTFGAAREEEGYAYIESQGLPLAKVRAGIEAVGGWAEAGRVPDVAHGGDPVAFGIASRAFAAAYTRTKLVGTALAVVQ